MPARVYEVKTKRAFSNGVARVRSVGSDGIVEEDVTTVIPGSYGYARVQSEHLCELRISNVENVKKLIDDLQAVLDAGV